MSSPRGPSNANNTVDYAVFLPNQRKDYDAAEAMDREALALNPNDATAAPMTPTFC